MNIDFETIMKKQIEQIANDEIEKMIREKANELLGVGMYCRTLNEIVKIAEIKDGVMTDNKGHLHFGDYIKASFNVIDILEIGDYVNGREVYKINWDSLGLILETTDYFKFREKDIKSIVTKEQFEQMCYKLGE